MTLREKRERSEYDRHLDGWTREELVAYIHELEETENEEIKDLEEDLEYADEEERTLNGYIQDLEFDNETLAKEVRQLNAKIKRLSSLLLIPKGKVFIKQKNKKQ